MHDVAQQNLADAREVVIAGKLMLQGYTVSRPLSAACRYDLIAEKNGRFIKIQVKSLKRDSVYRNSPLPYPVYVLEAYSFNPVTREKKGYTRMEVDVIVGYSHEDDCFAAVPLDDFKGKLSAVVHSREGTRSKYFNSWVALEEVVGEDFH
jgi:hypothetical protein